MVLSLLKKIFLKSSTKTVTSGWAKPLDISKGDQFTAASGWADLLDRSDVLICDTETSGLGKRAQILEIALVDTMGETVFSSLVAPAEGSRIETSASDINGLTRAFLKKNNAPTWESIVDSIDVHLCSAAVIVGWNANFDCRILAQTVAKQGGDIDAVAFPWRDLCFEYKLMRPGKNPRLTTSARREGIKVPRGYGHRAEQDCRLVLGILREMGNEVTSKGLARRYEESLKTTERQYAFMDELCTDTDTELYDLADRCDLDPNNKEDASKLIDKLVAKRDRQEYRDEW